MKTVESLAERRRYNRSAWARRNDGVITYDRVMRRFCLLPLDQLRGLPLVDDQIESGVYFLWYGPALTYIGRSMNVSERVGQHVWTKTYTHATYLRVPWRCMDQYEKRYIYHYDPPSNLMGCP